VVHDETTLIAHADLPFPLAALPDVFSTYRRQVERACQVRDPLPIPVVGTLPDDMRARARAEAEAVLAAPVCQAARQAAAAHDSRASFVPDGRRAAGIERLRQWIWQTDSLARYKDTRDSLMGRDVSSRLSLWLATGALSPREVAAEVRRYEHERVANESTYWLVFELLWRDYFHLWVRRWQGKAFRATGVLGRTPCGRQDADVFGRWCEGNTGEPFVDAGMRELLATGQLSNRARQNVASWLTRTAGIDWRWGAAWFECHLLDYDVGPNWGNWQYVAGVGNDPRNRTFNVRGQAERYDTDGAYRARWLGGARDA
jgi:deoxyribodipyrimidine photo-lyase